MSFRREGKSGARSVRQGLGIDQNAPMPILVGTASWTDKSLIDSRKFYPPGAKDAETRLRYYATQFPMVEVDSSYYAMPVPATAQLWAERTPPGFVFNVKAFRIFTGHQTQPKVLPRDIQQALPVQPSENIYYATCRQRSSKSCGAGSSRRSSRCG